MRIEVSYFKNFGTDDKKEWAEVKKIFYEYDEFIKFLESDERYKYTLNINRHAK